MQRASYRRTVLGAAILGFKLLSALPASAGVAAPKLDPTPVVQLEMCGDERHVAPPRWDSRLDHQIGRSSAPGPADLVGGWRPRHMKGCAMAIGMSVAGVAGVLVNPIGGYIAYHIGYAMALLACT